MLVTNDTDERIMLREDGFTKMLEIDDLNAEDHSGKNFHITCSLIIVYTYRVSICPHNTISICSFQYNSGVYRCIAELPYYPVALRFNLVVEPSRKERDFAPWSVWR